MKIFVIAVFVGFGAFIALAFFGIGTFEPEDGQIARQQAFTTLFQDNMDEGKQDFFFIGTHCMTVEGDLDLPEYFTKTYNEYAAAPIMFSVENGIQSQDDPAYTAFISQLFVDFEAKRAEISEQISQETDVMQETMEMVARYVNDHEMGLNKCIGDRLIEEQSTTTSAIN
ncbi:MAG: hypothetical protein ABJE63_03100 [Lentilitoribacter sp.]